MLKCKNCEEAMDLAEVFKDKEGEVIFTQCFCEHCGTIAKVYEDDRPNIETWISADDVVVKYAQKEVDTYFERKALRDSGIDFLRGESPVCNCGSKLIPYFDLKEGGVVEFLKSCEKGCGHKKHIREDEPFGVMMVSLLQESGMLLESVQLQLHTLGIKNEIHGCAVCNGQNTTWREQDDRECCNKSFIMRPMSITEGQSAIRSKDAQARLLEQAKKLKW